MDFSESTACICCGIKWGVGGGEECFKTSTTELGVKPRELTHLGPHPHQRIPTPSLGKVGPSLSAKALTPPPRLGGETRVQPGQALNELGLAGLRSSVLIRSQHRLPCTHGPSPHLRSPSLGKKQELWLGAHADLPCPLRPTSSGVTSGKQGASGSVLGQTETVISPLKR